MSPQYLFSIYLLMLHMEPLCCVEVGIQCPMRWKGVRLRGMGSRMEPCLTNLLSSFFPIDHANIALTICIVTLRLVCWT